MNAKTIKLIQYFQKEEEECPTQPVDEYNRNFIELIKELGKEVS